MLPYPGKIDTSKSLGHPHFGLSLNAVLNSLVITLVSRCSWVMGGLSRDRALWLSSNVLPHEAALRAWLTKRRIEGLDIDDVVQETYAKLATLESVEDVRNPKSYFFQTAYSILITHFRRSRIVPMTAIGDIELLSLPNEEPLADRQMEDRDQLRQIAAAIASLPRSCQQVFVLRRVHGLSQREVADKLRLSENTVEHHMTRSTRLLMDIFGRGGKARRRSSVSAENAKASTRYESPGNKQRD